MCVLNDDVSVPVARNYSEREEICEKLFSELGPFWHLCTSGDECTNIFTSEEDFRVGMNLMGICADMFRECSGVRIYTFILMNNHIHIILSGEQMACGKMFYMFKKRLNMYFSRSASKISLFSFNEKFFSITSLKQLRNELAYVNRNAYVANSSYTPYSYPWGAGYLFFNNRGAFDGGLAFSSLSFREKRNICKGRVLVLSNNIMVLRDMILPSSFCYLVEAECFFRDAHHYFSLLSKNYEAFSEVAKGMGDSIVLSDQEVYSAISSICFNKYHVKRPSLLPADAKMNLARVMHFDYRSSNKQIGRILRLDMAVVDELFPMAIK